jgi:serine/threonine protein kinase/Tol biopolymer transport system component
MSPNIGTSIGPYEIVSLLGSGGMGEVYRARDSRLRRDVALKVLPERFALDADRLARFTREARVLASLNHLNIAGLHGIEESNGRLALVLELVDGETLADRIARGPIPLADGWAIARQIADGLEAAHDAGVIHRDLKPSNIHLRPDGVVKILDFGLAKALDPAEPADAASPTMTAPATNLGVVVGTAPYMSPEQAQGRPVDKRTDIWAFGSVLYEILTRKRAFEGTTDSETLAFVMTREPDWSLLTDAVPPSVHRLLRRCLERDRKRRLADIADARLELAEGADPVSTNARPVGIRPRRAREIVAWSTAGIGLILAVAAAYVRPPREVPGRLRFTLLVPRKPIESSGFALSPDGSRLAYVALGPSGDDLVWIRPLDKLEPTPLAGTEGAYSPFWSPDGGAIAFFARGKLRRIPVSGGAVQTLCDVLSPAAAPAGAWSPEGVIVFAQSFGPLQRVSDQGGSAAPVTVVDQSRKEFGHYSPAFLPDGERLIYDVGASPENSGIYLSSLKSSEKTPILSRRANQFAVMSTGVLLFIEDGLLKAQRMDFEPPRLVRTSFPVAERVRSVSAARDGTIVYSGAGTSLMQLTWFDRSGKRMGTVGRPGNYLAPALSPDNSTVAVARDGDIWLLDNRGSESRLTSDGGSESFPVWSPDGQNIVYTRAAANAVTGGTLLRRHASGDGEPQILLEEDNIIPYEWSADGKFVTYLASGRTTLGDLYLLPMLKPPKPESYLATRFHERDNRLSPDGKWMAYDSGEAERFEVWVRTYPFSEKRRLISISGGWQPIWRADGKELFYLGLDQTLMAVDVKTTPDFEAGIPRPLFKLNTFVGTVRNSYAPSRDGQQFLVNSLVEDTASSLVVVTNLPASLPD